MFWARVLGCYAKSVWVVDPPLGHIQYQRCPDGPQHIHTHMDVFAIAYSRAIGVTLHYVDVTTGNVCQIMFI
jgi:hypothetical protein